MHSRVAFLGERPKLACHNVRPAEYIGGTLQRVTARVGDGENHEAIKRQ
jgi:hypothetical protein